jgi:hypothetical protein
MTALSAILDGMDTTENNGRTTRIGGITGAGFKPGVSGNPGGRPKGVAKTVRAVVGGDPYKLAVILLGIAQDPKSRDADRIAACKELLDRGWGKASAFVAVEGHDPLEADELTAEIRDIAAKLRGERGAR